MSAASRERITLWTPRWQLEVSRQRLSAEIGVLSCHRDKVATSCRAGMRRERLTPRPLICDRHRWSSATEGVNRPTVPWPHVATRFCVWDQIKHKWNTYFQTSSRRFRQQFFEALQKVWEFKLYGNLFKNVYGVDVYSDHRYDLLNLREVHKNFSIRYVVLGEVVEKQLYQLEQVPDQIHNNFRFLERRPIIIIKKTICDSCAFWLFVEIREADGCETRRFVLGGFGETEPVRKCKVDH